MHGDGVSPAGSRRSLGSRFAASVRVTDDTHEVSRLELFFDLVFVFAFTQVTPVMAHHHDVADVFRGLLVLGLLWWSWVAYAWLGNQAHADRGLMPIGLAVAAALVFVFAFAIPGAFDEHGGPRLEPFVLASAYVLVRLIHIGLYLLAARDDRGLRRQVLVSAAAAVVPMAVLMFAGALVGGSAQIWLWLAALVYDAVAVFVTSSHGEFRVNSPRHAAERFGLIVILALGETVISMGVGLREVEIDAASIVGVFLALTGSVIVWWLYFHRYSDGVAAAFVALAEQRRLPVASFSYTFAHFFVVAGIVVSAAGVESAMRHIGDPEGIGLFGAMAIGAGGALFLVATTAIWYRMTGRILVYRLVVAAIFVPASIVAAHLAPLAYLAVFSLAGALLIAVESRTRQLRPRAA